MDINWGAVVTQLLAVLLPPLALALVGLVSTWIGIGLKKLKEVNPMLSDFLSSGAYMIANAVEQMRKTGAIPTTEEAKSYAVSELEKYLAMHGFKGVDVDMIADAIEAAVKDLPAFQKKEE